MTALSQTVYELVLMMYPDLSPEEFSKHLNAVTLERQHSDGFRVFEVTNRIVERITKSQA